jgi:hypothetical protein
VFFKSKQQKRMERDIKVKNGIRHIKRQVAKLRKDEKSFLEKARKAKKLGDTNQYQFIRNAFKNTYSQRLTMERQALAIETAFQIKNQAEGHAKFAEALNAVSNSISDVFGEVDLVKTQAKFETAMMKAQTMEERMEMFLEMSSDSMFADTESESSISDADIDRLLEASDEDELDAISKDISSSMAEIEEELKK